MWKKNHNVTEQKSSPVHFFSFLSAWKVARSVWISCTSQKMHSIGKLEVSISCREREKKTLKNLWHLNAIFILLFTSLDWKNIYLVYLVPCIRCIDRFLLFVNVVFAGRWHRCQYIEIYIECGLKEIRRATLLQYVAISTYMLNGGNGKTASKSNHINCDTFGKNYDRIQSLQTVQQSRRMP